MSIETLEEWNDRVTSFGTGGCCDCEIPGQDGLGFVAESLNGWVTVQGWANSGNLYKTRVINYSGGGSSTQTYDSEWAAELGGVVIEALGAITTTNVPPLTGSPTTTFTDLIDIGTALSSGRAAVEAAVDWEGMDLGGRTVGGWESLGFDTYREITFSRSKFRKADFLLGNPPGSYLKITFDVADFFEDDTDAFFSEDEVLEWTGAFDINDQDNASHFTDFYYLDPPSDPGTRSIVNFRWTRFQSTRYGNKPQISEHNGDPPFGGIFPTYP